MEHTEAGRGLSCPAHPNTDPPSPHVGGRRLAPIVFLHIGCYWSCGLAISVREDRVAQDLPTATR
jgi:hypothetical protein